MKKGKGTGGSPRFSQGGSGLTTPQSPEWKLSTYLFGWHFYYVQNANSQPLPVLKGEFPPCCSFPVLNVTLQQRLPWRLEALKGTKLPSYFTNHFTP